MVGESSRAAARRHQSAVIRALVIGALALGAGCKKKPVEPAVPAVDPAELAAAAWERFVPDAQRATFGLKIDAPGMGLNTNVSGALVVDRPDRFRLEVYAPIVGPRLYVVSDGAAVNLYAVAQKTWMGGPDAEAVLREATGGTAGLKDLVDLLTGRMPFEDAAVVGVEEAEGEVRYTFEGPEGTRAVVAVDARQSTTRAVEAFDREGRCVLRASYGEYKRKDRALVPEDVTIVLPTMELDVGLNFRDWDALEEAPDAFSLPVPAGAQERDLVETIRGWGDPAARAPE